MRNYKGWLQLTCATWRGSTALAQMAVPCLDKGKARFSNCTLHRQTKTVQIVDMLAPRKENRANLGKRHS